MEWDDIDLKSDVKSISISKTTQAATGIGVIEKGPKNNSSIRKIYIKDKTATVLHEWKIEQDKYKKKCGSKCLGSKKIFTTEDGNPIHPDRPNQIFREIQRRNGLPSSNFHGLRHIHVAMCYVAGIDQQLISKRVGYSCLSTTQNIYAHVFDKSEKETVKNLILF